LAVGKRPAREGLDRLGEQCSQLERRAEAAERELVKLKLLHFLAGRIGSELEGVVTGVERFGLFVQGIELPAEGLVAVERLPDDRYRYDRRAHTLTGHRPGNAFRLGDRVQVRVDAVDLEKRLLEFSLGSRTLGRGRKGQARGHRPPARPPRGRERRDKRTGSSDEPMRLKVFGGEPQSGQASVRPSKKKVDKKKAGKKKTGRRKGR
ncbi:MAG: Ribonuclease, partial [Planctomycetota bacterium]